MHSVKKDIAKRSQAGSDKGKNKKDGGGPVRHTGKTPSASSRGSASSTVEEKQRKYVVWGAKKTPAKVSPPPAPAEKSVRPPFNLYPTSGKSHRASSTSTGPQPPTRAPATKPQTSAAQTVAKSRTIVKSHLEHKPTGTTATVQKQNSTLASRPVSRRSDCSGPNRPGLRPSTGCNSTSSSIARSSLNSTGVRHGESGRRAPPAAAARPQPKLPDKAATSGVEGRRQSAVGAGKQARPQRAVTSPLSRSVTSPLSRSVKSPPVEEQTHHSVTSLPSSTTTHVTEHSASGTDQSVTSPPGEQETHHQSVTSLTSSTTTHVTEHSASGTDQSVTSPASWTLTDRSPDDNNSSSRSASQHSTSSVKSWMSSHQCVSSGSSSFGSAVTRISSCDLLTEDAADRDGCEGEKNAASLEPQEMSRPSGLAEPSSMSPSLAGAEVTLSRTSARVVVATSSGVIVVKTREPNVAPEMSPQVDARETSHSAGRTSTASATGASEESFPPELSPEDARHVTQSQIRSRECETAKDTSANEQCVPPELSAEDESDTTPSQIHTSRFRECENAKKTTGVSKQSVSLELSSQNSRDISQSQIRIHTSRSLESETARKTSASKQSLIPELCSENSRDIDQSQIHSSRSLESETARKTSASKQCLIPELCSENLRDIGQSQIRSSRSGESETARMTSDSKQCSTTELSSEREIGQSRIHTSRDRDCDTTKNSSDQQSDPPELSSENSRKTPQSQIQTSMSKDRKHRAEKTSPHVSKTRLKRKSSTGKSNVSAAVNESSPTTHKHAAKIHSQSAHSSPVNPSVKSLSSNNSRTDNLKSGEGKKRRAASTECRRERADAPRAVDLQTESTEENRRAASADQWRETPQNLGLSTEGSEERNRRAASADQWREAPVTLGLHTEGSEERSRRAAPADQWREAPTDHWREAPPQRHDLKAQTSDTDIEDVIITRGASLMPGNSGPPSSEDVRAMRGGYRRYDLVDDEDEEDDEDGWIPMYNLQTNWIPPAFCSYQESPRGVIIEEIVDWQENILCESPDHQPGVNCAESSAAARHPSVVEMMGDSLPPGGFSRSPRSSRHRSKHEGKTPKQRRNEEHVSDLEKRLEEISHQMAMMDETADLEADNRASNSIPERHPTTDRHPTTERGPITDHRPTNHHRSTTKRSSTTVHRPVTKNRPTTDRHSASHRRSTADRHPTTDRRSTTGPSPSTDPRLATDPHPISDPFPTTERGPTTNACPTMERIPPSDPYPTTEDGPAMQRRPATQHRWGASSSAQAKLPTIFETGTSIGADFLQKCSATLNAIPETSDRLAEKLQDKLDELAAQLSEPLMSRFTLGSIEVKNLIACWKRDETLSVRERVANRQAIEECILHVYRDMKGLVEHNQYLWESEAETSRKLTALTETHTQFVHAMDKYRGTVEDMARELQDVSTALANERSGKENAEKLQLQAQGLAKQQTRQANRLQAKFFERNCELMKFVKEDKNMKRKFLSKEMEQVMKIKELEKCTRSSNEKAVRLEERRLNLQVKMEELKSHQDKITKETKLRLVDLDKRLKRYMAMDTENKIRIAELTSKINRQDFEEEIVKELKDRLEQVLTELTEERKRSQLLKADLKEKAKMLATMENVSLQLVGQTDPTLSFPHPRPDVSSKTNELDLWTELQATKVILKETQLKCVELEGERDTAKEMMKGISSHTALKDEEIAHLEQENRNLREELSESKNHCAKEHEKIRRMQELLDNMKESREADPLLLEVHQLREKVLLMEMYTRNSSSRQETLEALLVERDQEVDKKDTVIHEQANALRARDKLLDVMRTRLHYASAQTPTASYGSDTDTWDSTSTALTDQLTVSQTMSVDTQHDHHRNQRSLPIDERSLFEQRITDLEDRLRSAERDLRMDD